LHSVSVSGDQYAAEIGVSAVHVALKGQCRSPALASGRFELLWTERYGAEAVVMSVTSAAVPGYMREDNAMIAKGDEPGPAMTPAVDPVVGRLERVDARTVWENEERHFTPWLLANADHLSEALGIDLELEAAEHRVGPFELDLLGKDLANNAVLIAENQLTSTDHGHLGQLLTYAAGTDAGTVVWISTHFGEQHRQAIDWLNQRTDEDTNFFGVELELLRINGSIPAPHFKVVAAPNEWQKSARRAGRSARAGGGKAEMYAAFWPKLISRLNAERPAWTRRDPDSTHFPDNWLSMPSPVSGARFSLSFARGGRLRHEIYIDGGDAETNLQVFRTLEEQRPLLEETYGRPLAFEELADAQACRVADYRDDSDVGSTDRHEAYVNWFIDSGDRFRKALDVIKVP
jgi:hypothetical protein